tara:strand:- start:125 stop:676 length:552 start_codon:yes stop_codon:yes gene_type:complete
MGIPTLIKTLTASGDASLSFVDGASSVVFDSTYDEYMFVCTDIGPATDAAIFHFQCSIDGGSNYNVVTTSISFQTQHAEGGGSTEIVSQPSFDLAQQSTFQPLIQQNGNDADQSCAVILHLFSPASTTYVKHYYSRSSHSFSDNRCASMFIGGYFNNTNDIDAIQFKMSSGNFDGVIQMYGIA